MAISQNPIRTTVLYGIICGFSFIPVIAALSYVHTGLRAPCLILFLFVAGYAVLLSRWSGKPVLAGAFPLLLLFLAVFLTDSMVAFFLLALVVISWVRSGICFQDRGGRRLVVELSSCIVAGILAAVFTPASVAAWALGVWMLFLIQSLYFVVLADKVKGSEDQYEQDPFERASRQAEAILNLISI